jgi:hypothetical protein
MMNGGRFTQKIQNFLVTMIKKYEGLKLFYIDVFNRSAGFQRGWKVNFSEFRLIRKINTQAISSSKIALWTKKV